MDRCGRFAADVLSAAQAPRPRSSNKCSTLLEPGTGTMCGALCSSQTSASYEGLQLAPCASARQAAVVWVNCEIFWGKSRHGMGNVFDIKCGHIYCRIPCQSGSHWHQNPKPKTQNPKSGGVKQRHPCVTLASPLRHPCVTSASWAASKTRSPARHKRGSGS